LKIIKAKKGGWVKEVTWRLSLPPELEAKKRDFGRLKLRREVLIK